MTCQRPDCTDGRHVVAAPRTPAPDVAELLAALREVIAEVDAGQAALRNPVINRARAAIAKIRPQP